MEKKTTKKEYFEAIKSAMLTGETPIDPAELAEFAQAQIDDLAKKAVKAKERAAEKRAENDELSDVIAECLSATFEPIADIVTRVAVQVPDVTVGKVTYRLAKLVENGMAQREMISVPTSDGKHRRCQGYCAMTKTAEEVIDVEVVEE